MISMVQPLIAGNALRLFIDPPAGAKYWRVLKKGADSFTDQDDAGALVAYEGDERVVVDAHAASLPNEVPKFFRPFYRLADDSWLAGPTATGTPVALYEDIDTDVQELLRQRLEAGFAEEVNRQTLIPAEQGYIQVFTAPPSLEQNPSFPLITISVDSDKSGERAIGENISGDDFDAIGGEHFESEGWLADVEISIVAWSLNSDERLELRRALRRLIIANLPIFSAQGMDQINLDMHDFDAVNGEYTTPIYQVMATLTCIAPVRVGRTYGPDETITDIDVRSTNG